ncbi:MAG TPA: class I SAM-dependent methyltransferase [Candidatus Acidoferrales bacterium]|nr:class I SAM-dependent methyltransferase [Candidatus Acidoferrales bacterium]
MNESRRKIADELYARNKAHDDALDDRLLRFRSVDPPVAELLGILVRARNAQHILEIGTSSGYSTIWLADAVEETEGSVLSVDTDAERTELARKNLQNAGVLDRVTLRTEDASSTLSASRNGYWDFIFLDAERPAYPDYLPHLMRILSPHGVLAIDNVISHAHELVAFTRMIESEARLTQTVVAIGAGLRVAVRA